MPLDGVTTDEMIMALAAMPPELSKRVIAGFEAQERDMAERQKAFRRPDTRIAAYLAIDGERDYQDEKWGGAEHDAQHNPIDFVNFVMDYVEKAAVAAIQGGEVMPALRKIAALAVAAMETHGAPKR